MEKAPAPSTSSSRAADSRASGIVARLQSSDAFLTYKEAFQIATGLPLVLRPAGVYKAAMGDARRINPLCVMLASSSQVCASCLELQARMERLPGSGAVTFDCFAGISLSAVPVRLDGRAIAWLQTGQILLRKPTPESFQALLRHLRESNAAIDSASLKSAYFGTRVLSKPHYAAILRLLESFSSHLSLIASDLMARQTVSENQTVAKVRAFIAEHLGESIALSDVARAANVSSIQLRKVFKSALGATFTGYLMRARVEKTKLLLLNPRWSVGDAAREAGFQSVPQFNRAFQRITGETPAAYREHLRRVARKTGAGGTLGNAA
ncbi:MAG: helix-turn-helix domain-containing protein [Opitutaceae bacterium]|nr:helix-turn-helix domain-containing protein [Opitutaceae bacterium]